MSIISKCVTGTLETHDHVKPWLRQGRKPACWFTKRHLKTKWQVKPSTRIIPLLLMPFMSAWSMLSLVTEVIDEFDRMRAAATALTHFSQRYPKIPVLSSSCHNLCLAFDLLHLPLSTHTNTAVTALHNLLPLMEHLFKKDSDTDEDDDESRDTQSKDEHPKKRKLVPS